jgi:hypothetical protein
MVLRNTTTTTQTRRRQKRFNRSGDVALFVHVAELLPYYLLPRGT